VEDQSAAGIELRIGCFSWNGGRALECKGFLPYISFGKTKVQAMSTLTITAKGQVTLRKDLLKHLGVQPGEKIAIEKLPDGRIEVKAARPTGKISDAFGFLKRKNGPSLSIDEMNKIAARGWAGKR
jgi:bifunctional DNA-binding transcriptional regulator/antitoxin component of YhaV-PrlF toxin-antitoxin module